MELTIEELIDFVNSQENDFIIEISIGEEAGSGEEKETIQA